MEMHTETTLLNKYAPLLNATVTNFMHRLTPTNRNGVLDADDLRQEVTIAFLAIIRTQGEEAVTRNRLTFHHVMWDTVRKAYPLTIPYHAFGKQSPIYCETVEDCSGENDLMWDDEEDILTGIMIDQLPEPQRNLIRMKMDGMSQREIAHVLGVSDATVSRMIQQANASIKSIL